MTDCNICFQQLQTAKNEITRLTALVDAYNAEKEQLSKVKKDIDNVQNVKKIQLKNDYDNAYNIYLTKKKEYDDADADYRLYLQNGRDWNFQVGNNGDWRYDACNNACNTNQSVFPEGDAGYSISIEASAFWWKRSCLCSFPNVEIVKSKFNIKNKKKIESDDALAVSISIKNKLV